MTNLPRLFVGVFLIAVVACPAFAVPPTPVGHDFGHTGFVGWRKVETGLPSGVDYAHRPEDPRLAGAAIWFIEVDTAKSEQPVTFALEKMGISHVVVAASENSPKAKLLDSNGYARAHIRTGERDGSRYTFAAWVFYGSLNNSPRRSGVHIFAAPSAIYEELGGWVVPASLWHFLNPQREVADSLAQGRAAAALQAKRLAGVADIWSTWTFNTYVRMQQTTVTAMHNLRQAMICAGDASCVLVPANR